jgi:hypothetical protein
MSASADLVTITILVDNNANEGLASEHGFSAWIDLHPRGGWAYRVRRDSLRNTSRSAS